MSSLSGVYEQARGKLEDANAVLAVGVGMLLVNALKPELCTVYTDDPLWRKATLALPSALPADEVFGNQTLDVAFQTTYSIAAVELARRTTSRRELLYAAVGAQGLACAGDALMEWSGLVKPQEHLKDVGFSAVASAAANKYLLDKWFEAKSKGAVAKSRMYLGALAILDTGLTAGAYVIENGGGAGVLAAGSHFAGIVAGGVAHGFGKFRKRTKRANVNQ